MLNGIKIENLRGLKDTKNIKIKPVTILVGKNSSGKSTFARVFPLLKQSVEEKTKGPILWYGRYVDYGDFGNAVSSWCKNEPIVFGFDIEMNIQKAMSERNVYMSRSSVSELSQLDGETIGVKLYVSEVASGKGSYTSSVELSLLGNKCKIDFDENNSVRSISVNEYVAKISENRKPTVVKNKLIQSFHYVTKKRLKLSGVERTIWIEEEALKDELIYQVRKYVHGNTSDYVVDKIIRRFQLYADADLKKYLSRMPGSPPSWKNEMREISLSSNRFKELKNVIFASKLPVLLDFLDSQIGAYFDGVKYIEPIRASAQRYYRRQELAIDEIDSKGANVAMYLDSLSENEKHDFDNWMFDEFGVSVTAVSDGGHVALRLKEANGNSTNLADIGFGFSQLLPIVVQLWSTTRQESKSFQQKRRSAASALVMEQPELHLHPGFQARLADVICSTKKKSHGDVSFIIETHSQNLINRFGQLVATKKIDANDVQIVLFDKSEVRGEIDVAVAEYDSNGVLKNWPYGFFEPEFN